MVLLTQKNGIVFTGQTSCATGGGNDANAVSNMNLILFHGGKNGAFVVFHTHSFLTFSCFLFCFSHGWFHLH